MRRVGLAVLLAVTFMGHAAVSDEAKPAEEVLLFPSLNTDSNSTRPRLPGFEDYLDADAGSSGPGPGPAPGPSPLEVFQTAMDNSVGMIQNAAGTLLAALIPGATVDGSAIPTGVQVSSNSCPDYDPASTSFLGSVLSSLNNLEAGLVEASTQGSGTEIADDVAGAGNDFASIFAAFGNGVHAGGAGFGFGVTLQCQGQVLFTFGGGGGGGVDTSESGSFGGGAGGQTPDTSMSVGGGGGCQCQGSTCPSCGGNPDLNSNTNVVGMASAVTAAISSSACAGSGQTGLVLCASGGGGGGLGYSNCEYGAGYGVKMAAQVSLPESFRQPHAHVGKAAVNGTCSADSQDMLVSGITQACTNACSIVPGFYSCFCVCFKNRVINAGLAWGLPITCN